MWTRILKHIYYPVRVTIPVKHIFHTWNKIITRMRNYYWRNVQRYIKIYVFVFTCLCTCMWVYVCACICIRIYTYTHMRYACICMCMGNYIPMSVHIYNYQIFLRLFICTRFQLWRMPKFTSKADHITAPILSPHNYVCFIPIKAYRIITPFCD